MGHSTPSNMDWLVTFATIVSLVTAASYGVVSLCKWLDGQRRSANETATQTRRPQLRGRSQDNPIHVQRDPAEPQPQSTASQVTITCKYRTCDGSLDYSFAFAQQSDGDWRIYILEQPHYDGRADDSHTTHRLSDSNGVYVCWSTAITSLEDAKTIASKWAEATELYRKTGKLF
jgi:phage gp37-like protein